MRKLLPLLLLVVAIIWLMPISNVYAESSGSFVYEVDAEGNAVITKYTNNIDIYCVVPETLDGHPVVGIADGAFASVTAVQSVTLPSTLTFIGDGAFMSCTSLQNVVLKGEKLESIGGSAFWGCNNLQTIALPEGVKSIGAYAFFACNKLQTLNVPSSVTSIGAQAFGNTNIIIDSPNDSYAQQYARDTGMKYYVSVSSVLLNTSRKTLEPSGTFQLSATLNSGKLNSQTIVRNSAISWSSSNPYVATVDNTGLVTAVANGTAVITVTTADGNYTDTCEVTVITLLTSISLNQTTATINVGKTLQLTPMFNPATASDKTVTWTSSNPSVATVSVDGLVTAKANGTATITVLAADGKNSATCAVTVVSGVTSVSLSPNVATVETTKSIKLTPVFYPVTASNKVVTWSSSNQAVATVDTNGTVTGVSNGSAIITVVTADGNYTATSIVYVYTPATAITLNTNDVKLNTGKTVQLTASFTPSTASSQTVTWSSSNTSVATVSSTGLVQGVGNGTATITASVDNGRLKANCTVTVTTSVSSVSLGMKTVKLEAGKSLILTPTFYPANVSNREVTWVSSNSAVAQVDTNGVVTALRSGTAVITVITKDGNVMDNVTVNVIIPVTSITLDKMSASLNVTKMMQLQATVAPEDASDKTIVWKSSNKSVATVSSDGIVTAIGNGKATITATSEDGKVVAKCEVTVKTPVSSVKLNATSKTIEKSKTFTLKATISPSTASNKSVTWSSSNTKVATVSSKGVVKGIAKGTATITVTTADGKKKATCKVTVTEPAKKTTTTTTTTKKTETTTTTKKETTKTVDKTVQVTGIKLSVESTSFRVNKTYTLKATVSPSNATDKTIKWTSSDPKVVSVNSSGKITILKAGKATITATAHNGKKATITIVAK